VSLRLPGGMSHPVSIPRCLFPVMGHAAPLAAAQFVGISWKDKILYVSGACAPALFTQQLL
jgi:hypothetical protein